jgi:hypothetical protein
MVKGSKKGSFKARRSDSNKISKQKKRRKRRGKRKDIPRNELQRKELRSRVLPKRKGREQAKLKISEQAQADEARQQELQKLQKLQDASTNEPKKPKKLSKKEEVQFRCDVVKFLCSKPWIHCIQPLCGPPNKKLPLVKLRKLIRELASKDQDHLCNLLDLKVQLIRFACANYYTKFHFIAANCQELWTWCCDKFDFDKDCIRMVNKIASDPSIIRLTMENDVKELSHLTDNM